MNRKKTLADYWACIFLIGAGLMFYFASIEPQDDIAFWYNVIALVALVLFAVALIWSKAKLGEYFSNLSGGH